MHTEGPRPNRPASSPVDAVLFDFTGVITNSPFVGLAQLEEETGVAPGSLVRLVMGDYDQDTDHPWHRLERGEIPAADYYNLLVALAAESGMEVDFGAVFRRLGDLSVRPEVVTRIQEIHDAGWKTALVTNNIKEFGEAWRRLLPVETLFDQVIDSCVIGVRKPDPAIYHHALAGLGGVAAERAVFVDDVESNVIGARRAGLHALLFAEVEASLAALDAMLAGSEPVWS